MYEEFFDIFEDIERLRRAIQRKIARYFRRIPEFFEFEVPRADIYEEGDEIVVRIELPGIDKKATEVYVREDSIEIRAKVKKEKEISGENYYRKERVYSSFYRVIPLPVKVDESTARAKYEDGILEIRVKKKEGVRGRRVEIE